MIVLLSTDIAGNYLIPIFTRPAGLFFVKRCPWKWLWYWNSLYQLHYAAIQTGGQVPLKIITIPLVAEWNDGRGPAVHQGVLTELLDNGPGGAVLAVIISHHPPHPSSPFGLSDGLHWWSQWLSVHISTSLPPPDSSSLYLIHCPVNKSVSSSIICCFNQSAAF